MIITENTTNGQATLVDHTRYDLTVNEAACKLHAGEDIIAQPCGDPTSDILEEAYPGPERLYASDFKTKSLTQIYNWLRGYAQFGVI